MENKNGKIITVSFLLMAALALLVSRVLFETASAAYGPIAKFYSQDIAKHGLPMLVALITFASLQFNKGVVKWADEVITETMKVVWVSKKDIVAMTIVTIVMVMISSVVLMVFDFASSNAVKLILN